MPAPSRFTFPLVRFCVSFVLDFKSPVLVFLTASLVLT
jgi:hypothetical protein